MGDMAGGDFTGYVLFRHNVSTILVDTGCSNVVDMSNE